ncbi:MAG: aldehyde dehydrogenase family protein [Pseudomonadota bacterium]
MIPLLINGEGITTGQVVANINPSNTADVIDEAAQADPHHVQMAIASARAAAPGWAMAGPVERHRVLAKTAQGLQERAAELGHLLAREEGKTRAEAIAEVERAAHIFAFFAGEALRLGGETGASMRPGVGVEVTPEPLGVVALITPWNYPMAIPAWKIAPALCYGNTVILKPAELVPSCAAALIDAINAAGAPAGVVNLVMGAGRVVGAALVDSPAVDGLSFTGSQATGQAIAVAAAKSLKRVQLEMGGSNPLVVLDDCDLELAVTCAVDGSFYSTGQRCTASRRLIVTDGVYSRFVERVAERVRALRVDDALKAGTEIGPVVSDEQLEQNLQALETARREGGSVRAGGERLTRATPGHYMQPALVTDTTPEMTLNREEVFGPIASVLRARDYDEALKLANDTPFGLTAGVCTQSLARSTHFKRHAQAGMVMVNLPTAGVDVHVPFGGRKASSYGPREQGEYARTFYTIMKTAYTRA